MPSPRHDEAEDCFERSLRSSRDLGARGWELRTAVSLAALWVSQRRGDEARTLLPPLLEQFTEGFETADLAAAERLLATLD